MPTMSILRNCFAVLITVTVAYSARQAVGANPDDRAREIAAMNYHGIGFSTTHRQFLRKFPYAKPVAPADDSGVISYAIDDIDGKADTVWLKFLGNRFLCLGFTYHADRIGKYGGAATLLDEAKQRFGPPKVEDEAVTVWRFPAIDRTIRAGSDGTNWNLLVTRDSVQKKVGQPKSQQVAKQDSATPLTAEWKVTQEPAAGVAETTNQEPVIWTSSLVDNPHIPARVLAGIRKRAARTHPHDYSTQLYVINRQTEAYLELRGLRRPQNVPPSVYKRIRRRAEWRHPDDYSTQLFVIRRQMDAFQRLKEMKAPTGVAGSHFFSLKAKASQRQPGDYSTQLYLLNRQLDEYLRYRQRGLNGECITRYLLKKM